MARPSLHLFSLPPELLDSLTPRNYLRNVREAPEGLKEEEPIEAIPSDPSASRSCNICPSAVFANSDVEGHRSHFRTDWHRYNVKAKLSNGKLATEREFAILVEGMCAALLTKKSCSNPPK